MRIWWNTAAPYAEDCSPSGDRVKLITSSIPFDSSFVAPLWSSFQYSFEIRSFPSLTHSRCLDYQPPKTLPSYLGHFETVKSTALRPLLALLLQPAVALLDPVFLRSLYCQRIRSRNGDCDFVEVLSKPEPRSRSGRRYQTILGSFYIQRTNYKCFSADFRCIGSTNEKRHPAAFPHLSILQQTGRWSAKKLQNTLDRVMLLRFNVFEAMAKNEVSMVYVNDLHAYTPPRSSRILQCVQMPKRFDMTALITTERRQEVTHVSSNNSTCVCNIECLP